MIWTTIALALFSLNFTTADHEGSSDPLDWLREGVPGEPGNLYCSIKTYPSLKYFVSKPYSLSNPRFTR